MYHFSVYSVPDTIISTWCILTNGTVTTLWTGSGIFSIPGMRGWRHHATMPAFSCDFFIRSCPDALLCSASSALPVAPYWWAREERKGRWHLFFSCLFAVPVHVAQLWSLSSSWFRFSAFFLAAPILALSGLSELQPEHPQLGLQHTSSAQPLWAPRGLAWPGKPP